MADEPDSGQVIDFAKAVPNLATKDRDRNQHAELGLLSALLHEPACLFRVADDLEDHHFADPLHGQLYELFAQRIIAGGKPDVLSMARDLDQVPTLDDLPSPEELLFRLANYGGNPAAIEDYATSIRHFWQRRRIDEIGQEARFATAAMDTGQDPADLAGDLMVSLTEVQTCSRGQMVEVGEANRRLLETLRDGVTRYPTGLDCLDEATEGGLMAGRLYGFAARQKVGKTFLASSISYNLNEAGVRHLFIAGEMGSNELHLRMIARRVGVTSATLSNPDSPRDEGLYERVDQAMASMPQNLVYHDSPGLTFDALKRQVYRAIHQEGIKGFVLDYLQLVRGQERLVNQAQLMDEVCQWIAEVCKKHKLFAVVLAQLNQAGGTGASGLTGEANIRGGEGLRMACDQLYFLHTMDKTKFEDDDPTAERGRWLEMIASRYTVKKNAGATETPALLLDLDGPHFRDYGDDIKRA